MTRARETIGNREFIILMALLMSLLPLTIGVMLPALGQVGESLGVANPNDIQLVVSAVFLGMAAGIMLYGPFSDAYGRKNAINLGLAFFLIGSSVALFSTNLTIMLLGRCLQGFGSASCRVITIAMIRDKFEGREMARVMSLVIMIFIAMPALAPSFGQAILLFAGWRSIFGLVLIIAAGSGTWLYFRLPETLPIDKRIKFSMATIIAGTGETLHHRVTRGYTMASGLMLGAFVGYLSSAQQIFQVQYEVGDFFAIYFGAVVIAIGVASFVNSKLVMKLRLEKLCAISLTILAATSLAFFVYAFSVSGQPPFFLFLGYLAITFFGFGIVFGNFNTLANQPIGHIAGIGNSVINSIQTLIAVVLGGFVGQLYDGTVLPVIGGFLVCGCLSLGITVFTNRKTSTEKG